MSQMQAGQMMGPYRLINEIGKGGMAIVWKAYHAAMDRYVAIKMLPYQFAQREEFLARFRQEAHVIAKLEHPHILPVYDYGESEDMPYLVMRLLEAGTLTERIMAGSLPVTEIDRIFTQLAEALEYAHEKGVIHRDVKPSNAMLDLRGEIFLTDFGIAKIAESAVQLTATGTITGTPEYMSPEQAQGMKIDHRTDIYSLGVVLYEMLTGQVPYHAETPIAVILMKIQNPLPPPSVVNPDIPDPLESVLLKALTKEPQDRFASMGDFLAAWKKALALCTPTQKVQQEAILSAERQGKVAGVPGEAGRVPGGGAGVPGEAGRVPGGGAGVPGGGAGVPAGIGERAVKPEKTPPMPTKRGAFPWAWAFGGAGLLVLFCGMLFGSVAIIRLVTNTPVPTTTLYVLAAAPKPTDTAEVLSTDTPLGEVILPTETPAVESLPPTWTASPLPTYTPMPSDTPRPTGLPAQVKDSQGVSMVMVPGGSFQMGSDLGEIMQYCPQWNQGGQCLDEKYSDEAGVHQVLLDAFYIDQFEVTNKAFAQCVQANECQPPADISSSTHDNYYGNPEFDRYPVIHVTWNEAKKYCNWRGGRLPTEAEWEKAARGTDQLFFPWGNDFVGLKANLCDVNCQGSHTNKDLNDGYADIAPVGAFAEGKSPYGAFDMAGNVWEWVADWYDKTFYSTQLQGSKNPSGPKIGRERVLRGGSWVSNVFNLRTALRYYYNPEQQADHIGFRCVREP